LPGICVSCPLRVCSLLGFCSDSKDIEPVLQLSNEHDRPPNRNEGAEVDPLCHRAGNAQEYNRPRRIVKPCRRIGPCGYTDVETRYSQASAKEGGRLPITLGFVRSSTEPEEDVNNGPNNDGLCEVVMPKEPPQTPQKAKCPLEDVEDNQDRTPLRPQEIAVKSPVKYYYAQRFHFGRNTLQERHLR
jgi:hypothetical protein